MQLTERSGRVRAARRLTARAQREKAQRFLVEGPQAVREALRRPDLVIELFATSTGRERHPELVAAAEVAGVPTYDITDEALRTLAETITPQGLVAVCHLLPAPLEQALPADPRLVVVLSEVRDPGNAGTVIRTADAAGADAVLLSSGSVDVHNGKCVRASAGSVFHLPIAAEVAVSTAVATLQARGLAILAADAGGDWDLDRLEAAGDLAHPTAWIFGNEARGLPDEIRVLADRVVAVPIYGRAESLNLASAAAVCLYASARAIRMAVSTDRRKTKLPE